MSAVDRQAMFRFVRSLLADPKQAADEKSETPAKDVVFSDPNQLVTLSVAFWIEGALRGCRVVHQQPFKDALRQAALHATRDSRFKPIEQEEFAAARIEITLLTPWQTISLDQLKGQQSVDPDKAYRITYKNQQGWLLPEVFNCLRFRGIEDFLRTLITEKAGIRGDSPYLTQAKIEVFEADDYIESEDKKRIHLLFGPLLTIDQRYESYDELFTRDLETMLHQAAEQLLRIQEKNGNISPVIDPLSGKMKQIDWVRLALTGVALESVGRVTGTEKYRTAALRIGKYIWKYGYDHPYLDNYTKTLCCVYYAEYLWLAGRTDEAKSIAWEVSKQLHSIRFEPILLLKSASFLLLFEEKDFMNLAVDLFESVWSDFMEKSQSKGGSVELARYPELSAVAEKLFETTREEQYHEKAVQVNEWFARQQHPRGDFPSSTGSGFSYTRGTGKIFEVLASHPNEYRENILRVFVWLRSIQYTRENTFFVQSELREKILGGFRHDVLNQEVWIDASAHVLLGGSRLLQKLRATKEHG